MRKMTARLLVVVVLAGVGAALLAQTPLGTGFTFQGRVKQAGQLVNDSCDFEFTLWDAATDGGQVGPTLNFAGPGALPVSQGLFSAKLDFGAAALNGDERWLAVAVGCPSGQPLIPVSPRQEITAAPYAAYSLDGKPPSSLDAPDGDPVDAVSVADDGSVSIPSWAGIIVPFGGSTPPAGWLLCDGAEVDRTTFGNLFDAIGTAWGSGNGATTFHLPDLRGRFLRGLDNGAGNDPDSAGRTASNAGGNTGDNIGSFQQDNLASHNHQAEGNGGNLVSRFSNNLTPNTIHWQSFQGIPSYSPDSAITAPGMSGGSAPASSTAGVRVSGSTGTASGSFGTADNRPVNCYVNYIIKQ